jgi:hypothetical protein
MNCSLSSILSCNLFVSVYSQLCQFQLTHFRIAFEDILSIVTSCTATEAILVALSENEINQFSGIIYEATLETVYYISGVGLRMKEEIMKSEEIYFREIVSVLGEKKNWTMFLEETPSKEFCWNRFLLEVEEHLRLQEGSKEI